MKNWILEIIKRISGRVVVLGALVVVLFYSMMLVLFNMQIVNGQDIQQAEHTAIYKPIPVAAPRGEIYDALGRPLAVNKTAFVVKYDPSFAVRDMGAMLHTFIRLMEDSGESVIYDFPITEEMPRQFQFNGSAAREERWKRDMGVDESPEKLNATADEAYDYLVKYFMLDKLDLTPEEEYKVLALRSALFMNRITLNTITVSVDVKETTCAALEEKNQDFPGMYIDVDYLRVYPAGNALSHIVGYIRGITSEQYEEVKGLGYAPTDLFGQVGIEKAFELQLRGTPGTRLVSVDSADRRVGTEPDVAPVQGDKIYLTLDAALTAKCYDIFEKKLTEVIVAKLQGKAAREEPVTPRELLASMFRANNISLDLIMSAAEGALSYQMQQNLRNAVANAPDELGDQTKLAAYVADAIESGAIPAVWVVGALVDQNIITATAEEYDRIRTGNLAILPFLIDKLQAGEITPQMTNLNPSTGSAVVVDIHTGAVIAPVSYPTYDNNQFVNHFNAAYYYKLLSDPTYPMSNRAFTEPRAPGSTFKMISAVAGIEEGAITAHSTIHDEGTFTKAGEPYVRCWIGGGDGSHGAINVAHALAVSCNYFFCETVYRFGNAKSGTAGTTLDGIAALNKYMKMFGLNDPTGVEIEEYNAAPEGIDRISSPSFKEYREKINYLNPVPSQLRWADGDTLATSIGQSYNNYTSAAMAKYIATLANGGTRYQLHLLNEIRTSGGALLTSFAPVVEEELDVAPETFEVVYEGMRLVLVSGTAAGLFDDLPFPVAGKTGTAQQDIAGNDHATFACFAPADDPQIAIFVTIPYGNTQAVTAPAAMIAHDIIMAYFGLDAEPERAAENVLVP